MSTLDPSPRIHPDATRGALVPWLGHRQERLLPLLAQAGVTCSASPLHFMAHNRELALFAAGEPLMGLALDPLTHWRQLPASHRGKAFRKQSYGGGPTFDPAAAIPSSALEELAEGPLDSQRSHGATLLMTTYHLAGEVGTRARALDLRLAALGIEHFAAERMDQPALHAAVTTPRQLYAGMAVERDVLSSPSAVEALANTYAGLEIDGYWIKLDRFSERSPRRELQGGAALLGALTGTGRPVVCCGPGWLHLALLVADISSSVGIGEGERFSIPDAARPRPEGPRLRTAYHPAFMRSFQASAGPARKAFAGAPCRCGRHPKRLAPEGRAIDEHGALVRGREAREALEGSPEERREWLRATAAMASHLGHDAGVDVVPYTTLETVLDGVDAGRGGLAQAA